MPVTTVAVSLKKSKECCRMLFPNLPTKTLGGNLLLGNPGQEKRMEASDEPHYRALPHSRHGECPTGLEYE